MNINILTPYGNRLLIKRDPSAEKIGSIFIPKTAQSRDHTKKQLGTVLKSNVEQFAEGDRIVFAKLAGTEVEVNGEEVVLIQEDDVLLKL